MSMTVVSIKMQLGRRRPKVCAVRKSGFGNARRPHRTVPNRILSNTGHTRPKDQFTSEGGLMNQRVMVHKRPSAAGESPTARASGSYLVANINRKIAEELGVREQQVEATVALLDGGATVPFVARYRKEITGALDD